MIYFQCDYAEGCHPKLLEALTRTNMAQTPGYGEDSFCDSARARIREACQAPEADVHFLVGGTQTNTTVIASILKSYQGVLCAETGHINCHETGAIEATGHKVLPLSSADGTITGEQVRAAYEAHHTSASREHIVQPGMVYISYPTESGTLYSKAQLTALYETCHELQLPLFIDGARLGYGLTAPACDLTLPELARLCDVFYIGGTKCGALFGEAVVIMNPALKQDFRYHLKQRGGMLAKGRLLGVQFDTLFTDNLYFDICSKANAYAQTIITAFEQAGIPVAMVSPTNQQFVILTQAQQAVLGERYAWEEWEPLPDGRDIVRFCTSWATQKDHVDALVADIARLG